MCRKIIIGMILTLMSCSTAYAYDYKITSELPLNSSISAIAVNPGNDMAVVLSGTDNKLFIVDTSSNSLVKEIALTATPTGVAVSEKNNTAIVSTKEGSIFIVDLEKAELQNTVDVGTAAYAVDVSEPQDNAVVAVDGGLRVINLLTDDLLPAIQLSGQTVKVKICSNYVAEVSKDVNGSKLRLIDLSSGQINQETALSGDLTSVALDAPLGYLITTQADKPSLMIYDENTLQLVAEIPTSKYAEIVSVNPSTHKAFLSNTLDGGLSIVDLQNKSLVGTLNLFDVIGPICVDASTNILLAAHQQNLAQIQLENPVPQISSLIPEQDNAGDQALPLSITGSSFIRNSQTWFNEQLSDTYFKNNELINTYIPSGKLQYPGDVTVAVTNPTPGGGTSNELKFKILTPIPAVATLDPPSVTVGGGAFTLRVNGSNFLPVSDIKFNGQKIGAKFISSSVLEMTIDPSYIPSKGAYPVSVINVGPTSITSNAISLNVVNPSDNPPKSPNAAIQTTGSLTGKILNTDMQPVQGVSIKIKGLSTLTGSDGSFRLDNIPSGNRTVLLDGSTVTSDHYPVIPITVNILPNTLNPLPFQPYLHVQKNYNFKDINPADDTILTDPEVPGFEMRIPRGVNITGWDGKVNLRVSVKTVPADKLPMKPPPKNCYARDIYMFNFDKIGGGKPDIPIPVKYPNNLGLLPGQKAILWYYDESPNEGEAPNDWAIAGTCTVSADGQYIVSDPGVGIPKFCCGANTPSGTEPPSPRTSPNKCDSSGGDPVDLTTGYFTHERTDLYIPNIIPVRIKRYYRSDESDIQYNVNSTGLGLFGKGTYFEYDWWLGLYGPSGTDTLIRLVKPDNTRYDFPKQPDGTYLNTVDPEFKGAVITYNSSTNTRTLKMRDGTQYTFSYAAPFTGELMQIMDRNGNKLSFQRLTYQVPGGYNGAYLYEIDDTNGNYIAKFDNQYHYVNGNFFQTNSITDKYGRTVSYKYEYIPNTGWERLKEVDYPDGSNIIYTYDSNGRISSTTNGRGIVEVTNTYDANGHVATQTHADGGVYTFNYTIAGGYITGTTMTTPNGAQSTYNYNSYGYISSKVTPDGTTTYNRDASTNLLNYVTDPLNRKTSYTYYSTTDVMNGLVKTMTDPVGNVTSYTYETTYGMPSSITDALGNTTNYTYTITSGVVTQTIVKVPLTVGHTTSYLNTTINYNSYGLPTTIVDPNNNTTTFSYDPTNPWQLISIADPLSDTTSMSYDSMGRLASTTDAKGNGTFYGYDPMSRVESVTDAINGLTRYYYDGNGNLVMVVDANGNTIQYQYDNRDRISQMTDQLNRTETYTYYTGTGITSTTGDNLQSITDRKGQTTTFNTYDAMNRLTKVTYGDGTSTQYMYDLVGRVTRLDEGAAGFISYTYSDYGCGTCSGSGTDKISQELTPLGQVNYTYDKDGRRSSMTVAGQPVVNYTYDTAGRLTNIATAISGTTRTYNLTYDNGSRRTLLQIPLYKSGKNWLYDTTSYSYDTANRITSMLIQGPTGATLENPTYTYDANGNRTSYGRTATQPMANALSGTSYDASNEMLAYNSKNLSYDANGNLTSNGTNTYTWDARNRLTGISGAVTASFAYDALDRRISKTVNGTTSQYVYDRWDIIQEITSAGKTNYIRTLRIDEPLTRIKPDGTVRHYVLDALGSVIALTDDTGVTKTTYTYDAFGNTTVSGEVSDNPFQYTGRENDGTGLYCYRFRYYNPVMQRFISEDPIRLRGGINFYRYVAGNPIKYVDFLGLSIPPITPTPPYIPIPAPGNPTVIPVSPIQLMPGLYITGCECPPLRDATLTGARIISNSDASYSCSCEYKDCKGNKITIEGRLVTRTEE